MKRPDQDRFDMFARHFESLDAYLLPFCETEHFRLERNYFRQPSRVLKRDENPGFLIDISLSEHWLKMNFEEDMFHTITAIGYYEPPGSAYVWRLAHEIVGQERFSILQGRLSSHLKEALRVVSEWTSEIIMEKGQQSENLKRTFSQ